MKKYNICFFLFAVFLTAALLTGTWFWLAKPKAAEPVPGLVLESESAPGDNVVINQSQVKRSTGKKPYCLVAEDEFLLVFFNGQEDACLDTHMPLSEFPVEEQERLMEGIWFDNMMEIFSYLESYTS